MKKITLILGGIRSGKSCFAEQRAIMYGGKPVYIATAELFDAEMAARADLHRRRRGSRFELIEEPRDLTIPLSRLKNRTVLVDCMTLNLSARLLEAERENGFTLENLIHDDEVYLERIHELIRRNNLNVIFVSNEVGCAPVEANRLGRYFQDIQGRWNMKLAQIADEVFLVRAGLPECIKKNKLFPFRVSAPSYVLPSGYIENVVYLQDKVDDIQLLAFDALPEDPLFQRETLRTLRYLARDSHLTYSVHMPVAPTVFDDMEKKLAVASAILEKTGELGNVSAYTFHFDLPPGEVWKTIPSGMLSRGETLHLEFFWALKKRFPEAPITLENTQTPLSALDRIVQGAGLKYAADIGHLDVQGWDMEEIPSRLEQSAVVHLHGWELLDGQKTDHRAVQLESRVFGWLESFRGVLTVENYHKTLLEKSLKILSDYF